MDFGYWTSDVSSLQKFEVRKSIANRIVCLAV